MTGDNIMKTITLIPNGLFDDGSIDCLNFWLADSEGLRQVDASFIKDLGLEEQVNDARVQGRSHIQTKSLVYGGLQILEVQWG